MNQETHDLWLRAVRSYKTAFKLVEEDPDAVASRAYYATFYAVSALFILQGKTFTQHRAVEAAVHRDLVQAQTWGRRSWAQPSPGWSACAALGITAGACMYRQTRLKRL